MHKRNVPFSILIELLKKRRPFSILGIVFVFISIFILIPGIIVLSNSFIEPYEKYDFGKIEKNGVELHAQITDVRSIHNVSVNGRNPLELRYDYNLNGKTISDKFQTMDLEKANDIKVGSQVKIKAFEGQSKIQNLEAFTFPFYFFYTLPLIFLLIGIPFLLIGLVPALKEYQLYKNGVVKEATIISMVPNSGMPLTNSGQSILINYYYQAGGQKIFDKSSTTDFSILTEKKSEDTIKIFVNPNNENKSCLIPKLESMKYNWKV